MVETRTIDVAGLQALIEALHARGYAVLGPTVRSGTVATGPVSGVDDLPRGVGDEQAPGSYRLRQRDDDAFFGFAAPAQSAKPVFFPADALLWRGRRSPDRRGFDLEPRNAEGDDGDGDGADRGTAGGRPVRTPRRPGLRRRRGRHPRPGPHQPSVHRPALRRPAGGRLRRRRRLLRPGRDLLLRLDRDRPGPRPGRARSSTWSSPSCSTAAGTGSSSPWAASAVPRCSTTSPSAPVAPADAASAAEVTERATGAMGRRLDPQGLKELLYAAVDSPRWAEVAGRCLSCSNCTMVCPTCFCTSVEDVADLTGDRVERHRAWDSCFTSAFSYIHGGTVRESASSRYRQWMTHKLAAWQDQFGTSGCVGCGRCVTWCPVGIDITEEAAALRGVPGSHLPEPVAPAGPAGQ